MPRTAFLCYSRRDRDWVQAFYDHLLDLASVGHAVDLFWDNDITPGARWNTLLENEVADAHCMIVIATPEALASPDVQKERNLFVQKNKNQRLYVVRRVAIDLPGAWTATQILDCTETAHYRPTLQKLAAKLRDIDAASIEVPVEVSNPHWDTPSRLRLDLWQRLVKLVRDGIGEGEPLQIAGLTQFLELLPDWGAPFASLAEKANAAVVQFVRDAEPRGAAIGLLDALDGKLILPRQHDMHRALLALRTELEAARQVPAAKPKPKPKSAKPVTSRRGKPGADPFAANLVRYRQAVLSQCGSIEFFGFESAVQVPIKLEQLWIELQVAVHERGKERGFDNAKEAERELRASERVQSLQQAMRFARQRGQRGLVILGDPGAGKTTLLRRTVCDVISRPSDFGLDPDTTPLLLRMRALRAGDLSAGLDAFCQRELPQHIGLPKHFGSTLYQQRLLVLVDGLDEVPEGQRAEVSQWLSECLRQRADFTFVVTSRYAGYTEKARFDEHFLELHLRPFRDEQIKQFVERWYQAVETSLQPDTGPTRAEEAAADLNKRLAEQTRASNRMLEMAANPLLLTNICLVHRSRSRYLPEARHRLYDECLNVLFEHWRAAKSIRSDLGKRALQPVALFMHQRQEAIAPGKDLEQPLADGLRDTGIQDTARSFLQRARNDSGVLTGWSGDRFGFLHLGFQEYLAAREIARRTMAAAMSSETNRVELRALASKFADPWWQEVILLLLAHDEQMCTPFFEELLQQPLVGAHPSMLADCVRQAVKKDPTPFVRFIQNNLPAQPKASWWRKLVASDRAEHKSEALARLRAAVQALRMLAPLELERLAARLPKDLETGLLETAMVAGAIEVHGVRLVPIPAGEFERGDDKHHDAEKPRHRVRVPAFQLAATPLTNAQYRRFAEATGARKPAKWRDRRFNADAQPVVDVAWGEAKAYCEWAGLCLTSEAQWEYACRAGTKTLYWSGDTEEDMARVGWYDANSGRRTNAVGEKPANAFGLFDMHGNVGEWCADTFQASYKGAPVDGSAWEVTGSHTRVLRGGSWVVIAKFCRSASRHGGQPSARSSYVGFRPARFTTP